MKLDKKKIIIMLLAFFIPILIISGTTIVLEYVNSKPQFEGGENYLLADMASQYNSLYNYIHNVLVGKDSIFFSFSKGLGGNMASTVGYYLCSPFNILYMFISKLHTPFMTFIIMLMKFGLCSLFMNIFLSYKYKDRYSNLIFAVSYALMGFTTVYYFNNMWLDVIYMTPLVMLGINKLIDGKINLYVISLALAIMFNFYMAYMLCIFVVIYFLYELFCKYKFREFNKYKKIVLSFVLCSLLAGLISAVILIPSVLNLSHVMRFSIDKTLLNVNFKQIYKMFLNTVFSKTYIGTHNTTSVLGRNRPVIYVSLFSFALMFLYFFNRKIRRKEKILSLIVVLFLVASFVIPHLQLLFQAFSFPNGYIDRFSYFYIFMVIYLASKCFYSDGKIRTIWFILLFIVYVVISNYVKKIYLVFLSESDINISIAFVFAYLMLYYLYTRIKFKRTITIIILLTVLLELTFNYVDTLVTVKSLKVVNSYSNFFNEACNNLNSIDDKFYRMDGNYYYSYLDSNTCETHGLTTALSTNDGDLYRFFHKNGGSLTYTTVIYDFNKLPIFDSLLGIKYINSKDELEDTYYKYKDKFVITKYNSFKKIYEKKYIYLYENPYVLSLGYLIDNNNEKIYNSGRKDNSFENINRFVKALSGINEDVLKPFDKKYLDDGSYEFKINSDTKFLYLTVDYDVSINWSVYDTVYINDEYVVSLDSENVGNVKIENKYKDSVIKLRLDNSQIKSKDKANLYYLDENVFNKVISKLRKNQMTDIKVNGNKISGKINSNEDSTLFLSIPYDKGFRIYVDGKRTSYKKVAGDFIGVKIKKGKHNIILKYYSPGFFSGLVVSFISIIGLVGYNLKLKKSKSSE